MRKFTDVLSSKTIIAEDEKLGQGTFGEVYKGIHLETQRQVAMKKIIVSVEKDLFPITAQREIIHFKAVEPQKHNQTN